MKNPGPRRGASACRNAGLGVSRGEYVVFLDSDDALAPTCLQRRVEVIKSNPKVTLPFSQPRCFVQYPETPRSTGTNSRRKMISTDFFVSTYRGIHQVQFGKQPASGETVRGMIARSPHKIGSFTFVPSWQD